MPPFKDKWIRRFIINDTTRHKQGFTVYKVSSVIFLESSPDAASRVSVWKRYNDFKKLHSALNILHTTLRLKDAYPSFAKPKFFGRFEAEVVDERRECAVKFLEFIARHPSLFTSDVFVKFFETSLGDDRGADCSQSIGSDTSEDDKSTVTDNLELRNNSMGEENDDNVKNCAINGIDRNKMKGNAAAGHTVSIANDKVSEDLNWQRNWSIEKLVEDGRNDDLPSRHASKTLQVETNFSNEVQDMGQYILIAAAHMSAGFRHEAIAEYEEAFMQYKLGIATLRQSVQNDPNIVRRSTIIDKVMKYSERADRLYNRHLNCNISMISKPSSELQYYKVLRVMGSVMLVRDLHQGSTKVIKTIEKPAGVQTEISKYILRGKVPYMVHLYACVQTETTVFLILQYASGGKLWNFMKNRYAVLHRKRLSRPKIHTRSSSCEAIIRVNPGRRTNTSREKLNIETSNHRKSKDSDDCSKTNQPESPKNCRTSTDGLNHEIEKKIEYNKDVPTTQLLKKAHQLLRSVDATIERSNSIASRLNDSKSYDRENSDQINGIGKKSDDIDKTEESCDLSGLSISDSCTDLSSGSDKATANSDTGSNSLLIQQLPLRGIHQLRVEVRNKSSTNSSSFVDENHGKKCVYHDEDSGIEMEQELWRVPETILKDWTAQMLLGLEALHQQDVIVADLRPDNILVTEDCHVLLSYVVPLHRPELSKYRKPYTAPELCMYSAVLPATPAADIWSLGVILYEIFTGIPFQSRHPGPFYSQAIVSIPSELSKAAKSLLTKVLRIEPTERPTISEIKQLPFFESIDWLGLLNV